MDKLTILFFVATLGLGKEYGFENLFRNLSLKTVESPCRYVTGVLVKTGCNCCKYWDI